MDTFATRKFVRRKRLGIDLLVDANVGFVTLLCHSQLVLLLCEFSAANVPTHEIKTIL